MTKGEKWRESMIKKHGSWEKVQEFMKENQKKSRENYSGDGGFRANPLLAKLNGHMTAYKRWGKYEQGDNETQEKSRRSVL